MPILEATAARINELAGFIPYVQVNLVLGLQADADHAALELTKEFVARAPAAWPVACSASTPHSR